MLSWAMDPLLNNSLGVRKRKISEIKIFNTLVSLVLDCHGNQNEYTSVKVKSIDRTLPSYKLKKPNCQKASIEIFCCQKRNAQGVIMRRQLSICILSVQTTFIKCVVQGNKIPLNFIFLQVSQCSMFLIATDRIKCTYKKRICTFKLAILAT